MVCRKGRRLIMVITESNRLITIITVRPFITPLRHIASVKKHRVIGTKKIFSHFLMKRSLHMNTFYSTLWHSYTFSCTLDSPMGQQSKHLKGQLDPPVSQGPAGRVFQYRVGLGRVSENIPGSGSGSGRVGVSKFTIGYFRVSFLLSGISGYFGYFQVCRVFLGISGFTHTF